jgi:hypothetical protein
MNKRDANVVRPPWQLKNARWLFFASRDTAPGATGLHWWWRAIGNNGVTWQDDERFDTLSECQTVAATHGFVTAQA